MSRDLDSLSGAFAPPKPSPGVKERTLTAAREAMGRPEASDVWTRIWGNRSVRLVWAASIGCLLFGHVVMNGTARGGRVSHAMPLAVAAGGDDELTEVATLPRLTAHLPGFEIAPRKPNPTNNEREEDEETS